MLLRPYQEVAVNSASEALDKHGNTVVVAPTGAGKTIMLLTFNFRKYLDKATLEPIESPSGPL